MTELKILKLRWVNGSVLLDFFVVILATIVHTYFIQPYIIPTGSLENHFWLEIFYL